MNKFTMTTKTLACAITVGFLSALAGSVDAGSISYVKVTDDTDAGISSFVNYTHAIDFEQNASGTTATVNGVLFSSLSGNGSGFTRAVANGSAFSNNGAGVVSTSGDLADLMKGFLYNNGPATNGTGLQTYTITGLTPGETYDLRVYTHLWTNPGSRPNTLVFDVGGANDSTGVIDQDDSATVGFATTDSYFINYRYTATGTSLIWTAANQSPSNASWHLYGVTNQLAATQNLYAQDFEDAGLADGTFNSGVFGDFTVTGSINQLNPATTGSSSNWLNPVPAELGETFATMHAGGTATKDLDYTFEDNTEYILSFTQFRRDDLVGNPVTAEIRTVGGLLLASEAFAAVTDQDTFVDREVSFTTNGGVEIGEAIRIVFIDPDGGSNQQQVGIDNIELNSLLVPEPSSLALLGLGGLLIARRRK